MSTAPTADDKAFSALVTKVNTNAAKKSQSSRKLVYTGDEIEELRRKFPPIPTGIPNLDEDLGGGIVRGCITTVWGEAGLGKTGLAMQTAKNAQDMGLRVVWYLGEPPFDFRLADVLGLDYRDSNKFLFLQPRDTAEEMIEATYAFLYDPEKREPHGLVGLLVIDSLTSLVPAAAVKALDEKGADAATIGRQASMLSGWLQGMTGRGMLLGGTAVYCTCQVRTSISNAGGFPAMAGGKAIKFYSKVLIKLAQEKVSMTKIAGREVGVGRTNRYEIEKNQIIGQPMIKGTYAYTFQYGIDDSLEIFSRGTEWALITKERAKNPTTNKTDTRWLFHTVGMAYEFFGNTDAAREQLKVNEVLKVAMRTMLQMGKPKGGIYEPQQIGRAHV